MARTGDPRGALALEREALEIFLQVSATDPQSARRQSDIRADAGVGGELGCSQPARYVEAARAYREAMGIFRGLVERGAASLEDLSNDAEQSPTCPLAEFANPVRAVEVSRRAVR